MKARDVMTAPVITCKSTASVREVAKLFLQRHISAVPVVDEQDKLVGIISESRSGLGRPQQFRRIRSPRRQKFRQEAAVS